jgi:Cdc6-like AAA superfamily ATPase
MTHQITPTEKAKLESALAMAFTPHMPVNNVELFAGRTEQIRAAIDTVITPGLHGVIYGERGVGKSSLAGMIKDFLEVVTATSKVNCTANESFGAVVRRCLTGLRMPSGKTAIGFGKEDQEVIRNLGDRLPENELISPDMVASILSELPPFLVLVIDEFDRLPGPAAVAFADLIKGLSDRGAPATVILVGVAEDVNNLISNHASVERCLRQIRLPRMSDIEIGEIIDRGFAAASFTLSEPSAKQRVVTVSQGFPHYTHLLSQYGCRSALDRDVTEVNELDILAGMRKAVENADQSHRELYHRAATGTKRNSLWSEVVVACALADCDERGYFASRAVQDRLGELLGRPIVQQAVAFHLGKLMEDSRGPLLERTGPERRYRYRFANPLMKPFILMKAIADGLIRD